jgi:hypothetical protein
MTNPENVSPGEKVRKNGFVPYFWLCAVWALVSLGATVFWPDELAPLWEQSLLLILQLGSLVVLAFVWLWKRWAVYAIILLTVVHALLNIAGTHGMDGLRAILGGVIQVSIWNWILQAHAKQFEPDTDPRAGAT